MKRHTFIVIGRKVQLDIDNMWIVSSSPVLNKKHSRYAKLERYVSTLFDIK